MEGVESKKSFFLGSRSPTPYSRQERLAALAELEEEVISCQCCPRLVEWREKVAREKKAAHVDEDYWGHPVPGFGDPDARVVVLGLAPAAHGANRTGRYFTGDRSGDFLFGALYRTGFSDSPVSRRADDGLRLFGLWISAAVRCAPPQNKPTPTERDRCLPYAARELELLPSARCVVCLGAFAWDAVLRIYSAKPKPKFAHGAEHATPSGLTLLGCYHPSQQNTFTGVLTEPMLDTVLLRARELAEGP
jgi:uracil-DNA glycosylase family 4